MRSMQKRGRTSGGNDVTIWWHREQTFLTAIYEDTKQSPAQTRLRKRASAAISSAATSVAGCGPEAGNSGSWTGQAVFVLRSFFLLRSLGVCGGGGLLRDELAERRITSLH